MSFRDYGPFADVVWIAACLVAVFSLMLIKAMGRLKHWTWLVDDSPPLLVSAGARAVAVVCIALTYVLINKSNYGIFGVAALLMAALAVWFIARFDRLRKIHVYPVPLLNRNGEQATNWRGKRLFKNLIIGTEANMQPDAKKAFAKARKEHGPLALTDYLSGSGGTNLNNPGASWSRELLAEISNKLTMTLMGIVLTTVLVLYLSASIVQVYRS